MNNGTPLLPSDYEMASKIKKSSVEIFHATFDQKIKIDCIYFITDDGDYFKNSSKISSLFTKAIFYHAQFRSGQIISPET